MRAPDPTPTPAVPLAARPGSDPAPVPADGAAQFEQRPRRRRHPLVGLLGAGLVLPFALYYGLRLAGVEPWAALLLGGLAPLLRVLITAARARRLDRLGAFTLSVLTVNTAVGLITADARLLMALGGWLTALLGAWLLVSLRGGRSALFDVTVTLMPAEAAAGWQHDWRHRPQFRRIFRAMTAGWGAAFLIATAARIGMAYTLPVDVVPVAAAGVLLLLLVAVVQAGKASGRRHLGPVTGTSSAPVPAAPGGDGPTKRTRG
ncbi:VC0807 family protein [Kocuria sp. NPDC057446]|uniref:VC0807 family protein n=1 Tax=Kocuria sp. NPDC057446 TaxID=3346137 RepID=UPI0036C6FF70